MAVVERVEARPQRRAEREGVGREPGLHLGVRLPPVALEGEQVVAAPARDPLGDPGLAGERVEAHQAAREVQPVQQVGQDGQLAALGLGRALGEHEPALGGVGADQVQGRAAVPAVERAPHRLAVDRDLPRRVRLRPEDRPHPAEERALERVRVDQHQHPAEGVVRGDAVRQGEEALEPATRACSGRRARCPRSSPPRRARRRPRSPGCRAAGARPSTRSAGPRSTRAAAIRASSMAFPPSGKAEPLAAQASRD